MVSNSVGVSLASASVSDRPAGKMPSGRTKSKVAMSKATASLEIIGGGLAGSEAAWQAAQTGVRVRLFEMRPVRRTDAHVTDALAELVCSNSFRSDDPENNAVGLLHEEMRRANSLILRCADANRLPAGGALAVDRHGFARSVTRAIED